MEALAPLANDIAAAGPLHLWRFAPGDPASWSRWPRIEARVREALGRLCPDTNAEAVVEFLRARLRSAPLTVAIWLVLDETETAIGHVVAFVDVAWGEPYVLVHEAVMDQPSRPLFGAWLTALRGFVEDVNARYAADPVAQEHGWRVKKVQFWTPRDSAAFDRYFRNPETGESRVHATHSVKTILVSDL